MMVDKQKGKIPYGGNKGERDVDDITEVIEFSNISLDNKERCIKITKEAMKAIQESEINYYKKLAKYIKNHLEDELKGIWNVVIGSEFGAYISYDKNFLLYMRLNEIYFIFFKYGDA